ncbi:MAG: MMPL family transporter, partial [Solirubrobacterales bacterium]
MNRLAGFLGRRRRWIAAVWVVIVVCALPFASRQTEHLTGGGFDVPGSQSKRVSDALQNDFGSQADGIAVLLKAEPGASPAQRGAAVERVRREVATIKGVTLAPAATRRATRRLQHDGVAILPLRSDRSSDQLIDSATTLREDLEPGSARANITPYLVGQPTIWAGMQEISKRDLSRAEASGFPIVALILLVVFGSLAAAALPLALGF